MNFDQLSRIENKLDQLLASRGEVMTLPEVAVMLKRSKSNIYKLTMRALIPHYKRGKQLLFDRQEILSWVRQGRISTESEVETQSSTYVTLNS